MRLGVLFSGGKDSSYAMYKASKENEIKVLISIFSENLDSYMFHTSNIENVKIQSKKLKLPLIIKNTKGVKEEELEDLKEVIKEAKEKYEIEGIVTGAIASNYQRGRVENICKELGLECINPLWGMDQLTLLKELVGNKFKIIIIKIASEGFNDLWLGREIDLKAIEELKNLNLKYGVALLGDDGGYETFVTDSPLYTKEIKIIKSKNNMENPYTGTYKIESLI